VSHWLSTAINTYLAHPLKGNGYQWWSGLAGEAGWIVGLLTFWRHVNCHSPGCLRIGSHRTADGLHRLCRRHHPDLPNRRLSLAEIHERHKKGDRGE
jgi:hypothetical protein